MGKDFLWVLCGRSISITHITLRSRLIVLETHKQQMPLMNSQKHYFDICMFNVCDIFHIPQIQIVTKNYKFCLASASGKLLTYILC